MRHYSSRAWTIALGVAAGVLGVMAYRRLREAGGDAGGGAIRPGEDPVETALSVDARLGLRPVRVARMGPGVVELRGRVVDADEAERAVAIAQGVEDVHTVLNRLDVEAEESRLEATRERFEAGAPELHETHHYGMGVGMGRRRQGAGTDPDRPDDRARSVSRDLEPERE